MRYQKYSNTILRDKVDYILHDSFVSKLNRICLFPFVVEIVSMSLCWQENIDEQMKSLFISLDIKAS
jgi:TolB-like protein